MTISFVSGVNLNSASDITKSLINITVSGDGKFDFQFEWKTTTGANAFLDNKTSVWDISSAKTGFNANSFNFPSATDSANPLFFAGARIFGNSPDTYVGATGSTNGGVIPEPSTVLLLGTGILGLSAWRLRARKS